jgi:hypothetical protein
MKIEDIEAMLNDFSPEMVATFKTNQKDFKALTVQKVFSMMPRKKVNPELAKTKDFWGRVQNNMELFRARVIDEIDNKLKADFNEVQRVDYFFEYVEKNTNN